MYRLIALIIAMGLFAPLVCAQTQQQSCQPPTPPTFSREQNIFTEEQESDLGDAIAEQIQRSFRVIDDEEITNYLNQIGQRIVKHLPPTNLRFKFMLVDIPDANAFVLPGGRVYVSRKLVSLAQSEDEIAGVIGHEIGHLLARQLSLQMTRRFREVLGVTEVKDRRDIFEKYNQLVENSARKPKSGGSDREKDQIVADQIGLFAAVSAGYDPQGNANFFDRITENKGDTGNFFSELFGTTRPEAKRLREMLKSVALLPASCIDARSATAAGDFQKWQSAVTNYTGSGRKESLHAVLKKIVLEPPLRSDITHMRFSPDGKFILAQDDSGINVLTREPFAFLFHINAPEAKPAQFTPDSQKIIFYNSALRVEEWSVAERKLTVARELFVRKRCFQTELSPDGKVMACLDSELNLNLFDVASGAQVFQKKSFYTPDVFGLFIRQLRAALSEGELDFDDFDWINMGFSPDAHYFAAGARSMSSFTGYASENSALAVDLTTRQTVSLRGPVKKLLSNGFTFLAPDKLTGLDREKPQKSPVVSFPAGEVLGDLPLGSAKFYAPTRGNYLVVRPLKEYKVGVMDLTTKKFFLANKLSALDLYDDVFVSERVNGELGLYTATTREMRAKVVLPRNMLGRLRATALSKDLNWLAISERSRGAVWNLAKGERAYHVRGFRGGHFSDDGKLYADFPKFEQTERGVAQLELARPETSASYEIKDDRAEQIGQFVVITKPAKEDGEYDKNVILEVRDVRTFSPLWSKPFPKETPEVYTNSQEQTMACLWPVASDAAKAEIKNDPALGKQLAAMKEKEGDYFLQALDARTGKPIGRLLIETGKGSFRISRVTITGDWVVILDTENRVLIYSLSSGEQKGKVFGSRAVINQSGKLLCVENERGQLAIYDLASMEKRDQFIFSSSVSLVRFSPEGKSLFVLTANQTAYVLDMSALIK